MKVYAIVESGWEHFTVREMYKTKESAERNLPLYAKMKNDEVDRIYIIEDEEEREYDERMHREMTFKYNSENCSWSNCLDSIHITEYEVKD